MADKAILLMTLDGHARHKSGGQVFLKAKQAQSEAATQNLHQVKLRCNGIT